MCVFQWLSSVVDLQVSFLKHSGNQGSLPASSGDGSNSCTRTSDLSTVTTSSVTSTTSSALTTKPTASIVPVMKQDTNSHGAIAAQKDVVSNDVSAVHGKAHQLNGPNSLTHDEQMMSNCNKRIKNSALDRTGVGKQQLHVTARSDSLTDTASILKSSDLFSNSNMLSLGRVNLQTERSSDSCFNGSAERDSNVVSDSESLGGKTDTSVHTGHGQPAAATSVASQRQDTNKDNGVQNLGNITLNVRFSKIQKNGCSPDSSYISFSCYCVLKLLSRSKLSNQEFLLCIVT